MDIIDFFRSTQKNLHESLREYVRDLTLDEWHYTIGENGNHIAFLMLHIVRTEDNVLRYILQNRRPPIWNEDNWHERLELPPRVQGTGMPTHEAQSLRINNPALFMQYAEQVWQEYEAYLAAISDGGAELSAHIVKVPPLENMSALNAIGRVCIAHPLTHLGEITLLRAAQKK